MNFKVSSAIDDLLAPHSEVYEETLKKIFTSWHFWTFFVILYALSLAFLFTSNKCYKPRSDDKYDSGFNSRNTLRLYYDIMNSIYSAIATCFMAIYYKGPGRMATFMLFCSHITLIFFYSMVNPFTMCRYSYPTIPKPTNRYVALDLIWEFIVDLLVVATYFAVYYYITTLPTFGYYLGLDKSGYGENTAVTYFSICLFVPGMVYLPMGITRTIYYIITVRKDPRNSMYAYEFSKTDQYERAKEIIKISEEIDLVNSRLDAKEKATAPTKAPSKWDI